MTGDLNEIREVSKRKWGSGFVRRDEIKEFEEFISEAASIDLLLHGIRFTWSRLGGSIKSKLNRFLILYNGT